MCTAILSISLGIIAMCDFDFEAVLVLILWAIINCDVGVRY